MPLARRILVIGPSNIGDAILMSGVLALLRARYPDAHLTLVIGERAKALFLEDPRIHTLVDASRFDSVPGRLKLTLALWRYQPDVVVDLRSTAYPFLLKPFAAWRYMRRPPRALTHMRERQVWKLQAQVPALRRASMPAAPEETLWWSRNDLAHVERLWTRWGLQTAQRVVIVCPGARSHIKRWTIEGFAQVADRLITELGAQVIFSGEPEEEVIVEDVRERMRAPAYSAVGLITIRQLGLLMRKARLVITNDSASLHLASASGVPTVALFGPTDAAKYGPTSPRHRTLRRRL